MATPIKLRVDVDMQKIITAADKAGTAVDDLSSSFDDAAASSDDFGDHAAAAGRKAASAGDTAAGGLHSVSGATDDLPGKFGQVGDAAQAALSGDVGGAAQSAIGAVGDLAGSIPGIGLAASGVAAIAGAAIGLIKDSFDKAAAASDAARDSAYNYGLTVKEAGGGDVASRIDDLTSSTKKLADVQDIAAISGWKQVDVIKAMATGDGLPALWAAYEKGGMESNIAIGRQLELEGALKGTRDGFAQSAHGAELQAAALYDVAMASGHATGEVDDLGHAIFSMPDGKKIVIDTQTQKAYADIDALEKKQLTDKTVHVAAQVDTSAWDRWSPRPKTATINTVPGATPRTGNVQW